MGTSDETERDDPVGRLLPPLTLEDWIGDIKSFDELKGKIVAIDFWATWCHPCVAEIPRNNDVFERYKSRGVVVLGICASTGSDAMAAMARENGVRYPVAKDVKKTCEKALKVLWFPTHFLVDRRGVIRGVRMSFDEMEQALVQLLSEESGG